MSEDTTITLPTGLTVTEEEKIEFFKAFLADKPFISEVSLFNNQLKVKFKSLSVAESLEVFEQIKKDQQDLIINTDATYMMALTNYRLSQAIVEINGEVFQSQVTRETYKPDDTKVSYLTKRVEIIKSWPVFKLSALADAFKSFEDKLIYLTNEIQNENFWKAAK